jgi:hypothetical protein
MPYVGNEPTSNFASVTKDLFSGDGSTVAFTLSKASTTNGVAVFVENVRQEPTIAYAVSGTTLTFTAAPVTSSGNNIYVLHHNAPASTANHPAAQDLTAVKGTFTGDVKLLKGDSSAISQYFQNSSTGSGATDGVQIALGSSEDFQIWNYENTALTIATNNAEALKIDANGHITMAKQSAFHAPTADQANMAINTLHTIAFGTEVYDINGDWDSSSSTFTAPVTGKYQINVNLYLGSIDIDTAYYQLEFRSSNRVYYFIHGATHGDADTTWQTIALSALVDMDASDTLIPKLNIPNNGAAQTDGTTFGSITGFLAC